MNIDLIKDIPTPFFLYDETQLDDNLHRLRGILKKYWNNYTIGYSVKTNAFPPMSKHLLDMDITAEVVSEDEFDFARRIGFNYDKIICNGPIKSKEWIFKILENDIIVNVDSKRELRYIKEFAQNNKEKKCSVGLRVNLDMESQFPGESDQYGNRFGFSWENNELGDAIRLLKEQPNISIAGLHMHANTKSRTADVYRWFASCFAKIVKQYDLADIKYFDSGGGYCNGVPGRPGWDDYFSAIAEELKINNFTPDNLKLLVEPGISMMSDCFSYFMRVIDVKSTTRQNYVVLDGSKIHVDPTMLRKVLYPEIVRQNEDRPVKSSQQLVAFTCMDYDRFLVIENEPALEEGDLVYYQRVGAYTLALIPLFISYYPSVYRLKNNEIECVREKWGVDQFIQLSKLT